ncbi:MAG: hypothetical protein ACFB5Z_11780 [Elainellaceae cyanobacterium]
MLLLDLSVNFHSLTPNLDIHYTADPAGLLPSWLAAVGIFLAVVSVPYQAITGALGYFQDQVTSEGQVAEVVPTAQQPSPEGITFEPTAARAPELSGSMGSRPAPDMTLGALFSGGPESLVARAVGHAEGTRTAGGEKTQAYYGHTDPGNGVWNLGSFSYQHSASSPEDADQKQLQRLQQQTAQMRERAASFSMTLGLEEELNGIDLANQAPEAALGEGGYIDRLVEAYDKGLRGADAILWARTWSYINPETGAWDAPGLGNALWSIRDDQERRRQAIAQVLKLSPVQANLAMVKPAAVERPVL